MILRRTLLGAAAATVLMPFVTADVAFNSPSAGQTISGDSISVEFAQGTGQPPIQDFTSYTLQLCAGGNSADTFDILYTFTAKGDFNQHTYTAEIPNMAVGGSTANAYFLRTMGVAPGGIVINYSDRFTLSGMTGQFSAKVKTALTKVSGTTGPATDNQIANPQNAQQPGGGAAAGATVPYTLQSGLTRYAPMMTMPGSKITKKGSPSPQYPTTNVVLWTGHTNLPSPNAVTTISATPTFSPTMREATHIPPQPGPAGDVQRFLERWKD